MKKYLFLLLALSSLFSLVACKKEEKQMARDISEVVNDYNERAVEVQRHKDNMPIIAEKVYVNEKI
jgi:hypothetical protein